jgi:hypothetical protein
MEPQSNKNNDNRVVDRMQRSEKTRQWSWRNLRHAAQSDDLDITLIHLLYAV